MNNILNKIDHFDVRSWLEDQNISYSKEGKNISNGWIGINCIFCQDTSNHLGITPNNRITCWKCGTKGDIVTLIKEVEQCSFKEAVKILDEYQDYTQKKLKQDINIRSNVDIIPSLAKKSFPQQYLDFLLRRRFDPTEIIDKYKLKAFPNFGNFAFRIFIPCLLKGIVVNYTGMDITGKATSKYKHCPNDEAIIPMKNLLYNIDNSNKRVILVEGTADVWRIGDGAVATMGIQYTRNQIMLLKEKKYQAIFIMFDADQQAQEQAKKLKDELAIRNVSPHIEILKLTSGDPDDLDDAYVKQLRKELL